MKKREGGLESYPFGIGLLRAVKMLYMPSAYNPPHF